MSDTPILVTNTDFSLRVVLDGLVEPGEQFRISDGATVRARLRSYDGTTAFGDWTTLTKDSNRYDDWGLSTLDMTIPVATYVEVDDGPIYLDIEVEGNYVGRDGTESTDTYKRTWSKLVNVQKSPA